MTDPTKPSPPQAAARAEAPSWPSGQGVLWRRALGRWLGETQGAGQQANRQALRPAVTRGPGELDQREAA